MVDNGPLRQSDLLPGDRVVVIAMDNSRRAFTVTSVGERSLSGRPDTEDGSRAKVERIRIGMLLGREHDAEFRHAGNLVPGDFIYTPNHRSGLQYGKVVAGRHGNTVIVRWDESRDDWLRRSQEIPYDAEWISHESEPGARKSFFARIAEDRAAWLASPGRSGYRPNRRTGCHEWKSKERRWRASNQIA